MELADTHRKLEAAMEEVQGNLVRLGRLQDQLDKKAHEDLVRGGKLSTQLARLRIIRKKAIAKQIAALNSQYGVLATAASNTAIMINVQQVTSIVKSANTAMSNVDQLQTEVEDEMDKVMEYQQILDQITECMGRVGNVTFDDLEDDLAQLQAEVDREKGAEVEGLAVPAGEASEASEEEDSEEQRRKAEKKAARAKMHAAI